jgi:hypothetical protein
MVWANPSIAKYFLTHFYVISFIRLPWKSMVHLGKNPLLQANVLFYLEDMEKTYYILEKKLNQICNNIQQIYLKMTQLTQ